MDYADIHHPLEDRRSHPYGVQRYNPWLWRWEIFSWAVDD